MLKFFRKRLDKKGFTLVELLVVIAVLGIIAGIAIPRMSGVTDSFRQKADEETARNLARQVQIRVQAGITELPTGADTKRIIFDKSTEKTPNIGPNTLGETFDGVPQKTSGYTLKTRKFTIVLSATDIKVYNSPSDITDAAIPSGAENTELHVLTHGGEIN